MAPWQDCDWPRLRSLLMAESLETGVSISLHRFHHHKGLTHNPEYSIALGFLSWQKLEETESTSSKHSKTQLFDG